jgi:hypothetical protein
MRITRQVVNWDLDKQPFYEDNTLGSKLGTGQATVFNENNPRGGKLGPGQATVFH